jgi:hypothetical protein
VLTPQLREQFEQNYARTSQSKESIYTTLFPKGHGARAGVRQAGGPADRRHRSDRRRRRHPWILNQRQVELLVDAGFTPLEAITISTLNGAKYLGRDKTVGSIAVMKQADLVVINGNPRGEHRRHSQGGDRVQAGRRLRPGEIDRVRPGQSRYLVSTQKLRRRAATHSNRRVRKIVIA